MFLLPRNFADIPADFSKILKNFFVEKCSIGIELESTLYSSKHQSWLLLTAYSLKFKILPYFLVG